MNIKKLDEKEVVFVDQPWTDEERKLFSELLRKKKEAGRKRPVIDKRVFANSFPIR